MGRREKVLCTGAAGFIGGHLVQALCRMNYDVTGLIHPRDDASRLENLDLTILEADIEDRESLLRVGSGYSYVYHLAGVLTGPIPERFHGVNYLGTKNLVEVLWESGTRPKRFLFTSSVSAVGPAQKNSVLTEESPCRPISDYGKSKLLAEQFLLSVSDRLPVTVVRLPLVYGPHGFGGLYSFFKTINKGYCISAGHAETSLVFVSDAVEGMISAAQSPTAVGQVYFLGEDKIYSSEEIFAAIERALGKRALKLKLTYPVVSLLAGLLGFYAKRRQREPMVSKKELEEYLKFRYWLVSTRKARSDFDFEARVSFEQGAAITAAWYQRGGHI